MACGYNGPAELMALSVFKTILVMSCGLTSVADPHPHGFGLLDPHPEFF
jgi:hypothetical protein